MKYGAPSAVISGTTKMLLLLAVNWAIHHMVSYNSEGTALIYPDVFQVLYLPLAIILTMCGHLELLI